MEEWRDAIGFQGYLMVSNLGNIKKLPRVVRKRHRSGVESVQLYKNESMWVGSDKYGHKTIAIQLPNQNRRTLFVHRLVLEAFVGPCPDGMECCHNNGDASDNRVENLRWDTHYNNNQDRKRHGNYKTCERHHMAKLEPWQAKAIRDRTVDKKTAMREFGISNSQHHRIMKGESWIELGEQD